MASDSLAVNRQLNKQIAQTTQSIAIDLTRRCVCVCGQKRNQIIYPTHNFMRQISVSNNESVLKWFLGLFSRSFLANVQFENAP